MENFEEYYKSAQELLEAQGYSEAAKLVSLSNVHEEYVNYDNWNGGSDMYSISVYVTPIMYAKLEREKRIQKLEDVIHNAMTTVTKGDPIIIDGITIMPACGKLGILGCSSVIRLKTRFPLPT